MKKILVLVLNCGSSSIKFSIIDIYNNEKHIFGLADCLTLQNPSISWKTYKNYHKHNLKQYSNHKTALHFIFSKIILKHSNILNNLKFISHRVVHGGNETKNAVFINDLVIQNIKNMSCFAPLHNPINLLGIQLSMSILPSLSTKNIAVFDTSFHQTIPKIAHMYAIPYHFYKKEKIRRYGAHGISHSYVYKKATIMLKKPKNTLNIITCHLGGGCSITAICQGKSVDTSMGLTPLEGLVMGTRSGDIDPAIIFYMHENLKIKIHDIYNILTLQSGIKAINKKTSDFRYSEKNYFIDNNAKNSVDIFCYRLAKYISGYTCAIKGKLHAVVFTGGIGENSSLVRKLTISRLSLIGLFIDNKYNNQKNTKKPRFINKNTSIPILVIPTEEEIAIAQETAKIISHI
ncbi:acetate kinase [Buchnera aphidicola]|uniref:Acetate kinase n=1 Tax=Buchnera aphidicola (Anoecia oenotherae) TaxID=1241833 RepID=A0A4D6Y4D4_9GAMM|nr:acetate kinase [Buchnera aphidicola]QCI19275.1 acetate kinase [Buchnera aphidicola (Anoecia oenotherae)]